MKALLQKFSLAGNWEVFLETVKRFPLSSLCGVFAFVLAVYTIHNNKTIEEETILRLILSFGLGYLWFGFCQIFAEAKSLSGIKHSALAVLGFAPLLFITFGSTDEFFRLFFIVPALMLLIMGAPFVFKRSNDESFWVFNRHVWFGVAVSYVASLLLGLGVAAALAAVKYLFGVKIPSELWGDIFAFCAFVLGPIYALSFVPSRFDYEDEQCHTPTQVGFIVNWILAPLVLVYMAILYAYFIKIGVMQEIPKGQLSYMIVGFLAAGLVTYIVSWPLQNTGSKALELISKYFFATMIIPIIMQAVSIWMRIDQYGFTEKRYIVAMSVLWFAFIALGFLFKKLQLKHIPLSLGVLLLLASWGPWSARDVSAWSQIGRLEEVLTANGLLNKGVITPVDEELPFDVRKNISGIADYIFKNQHTFYGFDNKIKFFEELGIKYISKWDRTTSAKVEETGRFNFHFGLSLNNMPIDMRDVDFYVANITFYGVNAARIKVKPLVFLELKEDKIMVTLQDDSTVKIDILPEVQKLIDNSGQNGQKNLKPIVLRGQNDKYRVRLQVGNIAGEVKDGKPVISYVRASAFITEK